MADVSAGRAVTPRPTVNWPRFGAATAVAAAVAAAAVVVIDLLAASAGAIEPSVVLPSLLGAGSLTLASVASTAVVATLGSALLLGVLALATRRPITYFRVAATVLAALSLVMPLTIPGPGPTMRAVMAVMHVAVWATSVWVLSRLAVRSRGAA